jgi:hypothetical protein
MPRQLEIAQTLQLVGLVGLVIPARRKQRHLFDLTVDGTRRPLYFRWSWSAINGDLLLGTVHRHAHQIPRDDPNRPFQSWARGFFFFKERKVAIRPFWWPLSPYEPFDRDANHRVMDAIIRLLRPRIPQSYRFQTGVTNDLLIAQYAHYSTDW